MTTRNKSVTGKEADSYYQFDDLPVRVFTNGKEYLAGYTVAIRGNADFKPGNYEVQTSDYPVKNKLAAPNYLVDQWSSKGKANVRGTSSFAYRYGPETFPLVRSQKFSSNGDIHTMDSVIVLAGSTTADAKGARTGSTPVCGELRRKERRRAAGLVRSGLRQERDPHERRLHRAALRSH